MDGDTGFLVEDFLEAIAAQLDRTQDALRLKAAVRPLTYALKDFQLELKVFVSMDSGGNIRFRGAGPNEDGASTVQLGFTTITRPMIEENTVSLAVAKTPTLEEMGLAPQERQRLERLGVRNAGQLQELGAAAGASGASRVSGIPVDVLRAALHRVRPTVRHVEVAPPESAPDVPVPSGGLVGGPGPGEGGARRSPRGLPDTITLPVGSRRLLLHGLNLSDAAVAAELDGRRLDVDASGDSIVVHLPHADGGTLSVDVAGDRLVSTLVPEATPRAGSDPWQPAAAGTWSS